MVKPVDRIVPDFAAAGASIITFHPEASEHVDRTLQLIKEMAVKRVWYFNPATPLSYLDYVMDKLDVILLMSVNPGFGGQSFIPQTLDKLREVRRRIDESGFDIRLEVDGGVKVNNIGEIAAAGADMFVAGSAIFDQPDYKKVIDEMRSELAKVGVMNKFEDICGVAFDLDGTLVDSAPGLTAAVDMALYALELPVAGEERVITWIGNGADILMERALTWARRERATLRKNNG